MHGNGTGVAGARTEKQNCTFCLPRQLYVFPCRLIKQFLSCAPGTANWVFRAEEELHCSLRVFPYQPGRSWSLLLRAAVGAVPAVLHAWLLPLFPRQASRLGQPCGHCAAPWGTAGQFLLTWLELAVRGVRAAALPVWDWEGGSGTAAARPAPAPCRIGCFKLIQSRMTSEPCVWIG